MHWYAADLTSSDTKRKRERVKEITMPKHRYNQPW
jgi:hypothetical protein